MPKSKRQRIAHTEDWKIIQQRTLWPEQEQYELIRPIVLFGDTPAERAEQTQAAERTLYRKVDRFDQEGMMSLFESQQAPRVETSRSVPAPMRQAIVDLKTEYPDFTPNELATIGYVQFDRRLSRHTVEPHSCRRTATIAQNTPLPSLCRNHRSSRTKIGGHPITYRGLEHFEHFAVF